MDWLHSKQFTKVLYHLSVAGFTNQRSVFLRSKKQSTDAVLYCWIWARPSIESGTKAFSSNWPITPITPTTVHFLQSYHSDRTFRVSVDGSCSSVRLVAAGVPQSSLPGPVLYLMYTTCWIYLESYCPSSPTTLCTLQLHVPAICEYKAAASERPASGRDIKVNTVTNWIS